MNPLYNLLLSMSYQTVVSWYQIGMISKHEFERYEKLKEGKND